MIIFLFLVLNIHVSGQESLLCQGKYWTEDHANLMMKKFAGEWNNRVSWEKRAKVIRTGIISGMKLDQMPKADNNFNLIINNTHNGDGYIVENVAFESFPGFYVTGNIYRPAGSGKKNAAILSPHGHWNNRRLCAEVQLRCAAFARMGAIVFVYDMVGYSDSRQVTHDIPVVMVSAHFFGGCNCESGMPVHKSKNHQTNNVEIAALCAPRTMLLISDGSDWTSNTPRIEYPYIQKVCALYNAEHKIENVHFPAEIHDYGYNKRSAVYPFLARHLKLDLNKIPYKNGFDESFITILPEEDLRVFTAEHPIPVTALKGNDAVVKHLILNLKKTSGC